MKFLNILCEHILPSGHGASKIAREREEQADTAAAGSQDPGHAMGRRAGLAEQNGRRLTGPLLTCRIKAPDGVQDLLAMCASHAADYNGITISATWTQLSKLTRGKEEAVLKVQLGELIQRTKCAAIEGELKGRGVANKFNAIARMTKRPDKSKLFDELASAAAASIDHFNPQDLANTAWTFPTAGHASPALLEANLANTVWAFATSGHASPALFEAVARGAIACIFHFKPQELADVAWAFATVGHASPAQFEARSVASDTHVGQFHTQQLANTAWGFALADHSLPDNFTNHLVQGAWGRTTAFAHLRGTLQGSIYIPTARALSHAAPGSEHGLCAMTATKIGMQVHASSSPSCAEVALTIGYSIDIVAKWQGVQIDIEVDSPSHFLRRNPNRPLLLQRRQLQNLEGWKLCSMPYWEWDDVSSDAERRQLRRRTT
eukprot:6185591-Pleurochrysis_carterae.AAC.2